MPMAHVGLYAAKLLSKRGSSRDDVQKLWILLHQSSVGHKTVMGQLIGGGGGGSGTEPHTSDFSLDFAI